MLLDMPMDVVFTFGAFSRKLERVVLTPQASASGKKIYLSAVFSKLEPLLIQKYGPPTTSDEFAGKTIVGISKSRTWSFKKTKITLEYVKLLDFELCKLLYDDSSLATSDLNKI